MQNPQLGKRKWTAHSVLAFRALKKSVNRHSTHSRWWRSLSAAALLLAVGACSDRSGVDQGWQAYQEELMQLAEAKGQAPRPAPMPIMPRSGNMRIEIERLSIGLLDSLRLERCRLGQVVAQRNTALGQAQSATALLRYELDSMQAIEECLQNDSVTDPRIITMLEDALEQKQNTLPLYIDQVLTRSDAFRNSLRAASRPHGLHETRGFEDTRAALNYITQTFNAALGGALGQLDLAPYNSHMQTLSQSDFLPRHWRSMQNNAAWLSETNPLLARVADTLDCTTQEHNQRLAHIKQAHYDAVIEPLVTRWNQQHAELAPSLQQLMTMSVQGEWRAYMEELVGDGSHAERAGEMTTTHRVLWQQTLAQCLPPTE